MATTKKAAKKAPAKSAAKKGWFERLQDAGSAKTRQARDRTQAARRDAIDRAVNGDPPPKKRGK